ncbi:RTA-like protein, partial [Pseudomassariella vexata]
PRSYYVYAPSQPAAIVMCAVYGINSIVAVYRTVLTRAWIWLVMILALLMECLGHGVRVMSAANVTNRNEYIAQFILIILAPVLMAGIIYVVFGRLVSLVVPARARTTKLLWVPPCWITPIFVGVDIVALLLQLIGAVLVAGTEPNDSNAQHKLDLGKKIALAGISIQIMGFGLFSIVAARFYFTSKQFAADLESRLLKADERQKTATLEGSSRKFNPNWRTILFTVNASCALILVRSVYREIEFAEGKGGHVQQYEWFFYIFDALPIALAAILYNIIFPGSYLPYMGFRAPKD